jgi:hypothetical protein
VTARIGIDFGTANTVVARWDDGLARGEPVPLDGVDLTREAGRGVSQRVIPSLIAYRHGGDQRWVGAQVASRPDLLADPAVSVLQPARGGRLARGPGCRFPGSGAEVHALAGGADQLGPVTVRQPPGDKRPRPGPACGVPADLERRRRSLLRRIAWIRTSNVFTVTPVATPVRQRSHDRQLRSPAGYTAGTRGDGHQEGQRDHRARLRGSTRRPAVSQWDPGIGRPGE